VNLHRRSRRHQRFWRSTLPGRPVRREGEHTGMALETVTVPIGDLHPYYRNPRQGDVGAISESLKHLGQYRTIVVNRGTLTGRPNEILAGNHTHQAAVHLKWKEIDVDYVDVDEETAARIVAVDNRTNDLATYDPFELTEMLKDLAATDLGLIATGYDGDDLDDLLAQVWPEATFEKEDDKYVRRVESPIYEPSGPAPALEDLIDRTRTDELRAEIGAADVPPDVAEFLLASAERHTVFRYDRIANYYAHASAAIQRLMESSVLIIVDFDRAIELGYVKLNDTVSTLFHEENPDA
jgi:hypothetical protein